MTIYYYPNCNTCKKALKWLEANSIFVEKVHIVENTPTEEMMKDFHEKSGLPIKRFFNTSGKSYREGNFKEKMLEMTNDEIYQALAADGMLIKRPILDLGELILVGFKEDEWKTAVL